ncbi:hypothetical protein IJU97_06405 [bacterium]|nr:hypothetical protein [bacterium]
MFAVSGFCPEFFYPVVSILNQIPDDGLFLAVSLFFAVIVMIAIPIILASVLYKLGIKYNKKAMRFRPPIRFMK